MADDKEIRSVLSEFKSTSDTEIQNNESVAKMIDLLDEMSAPSPGKFTSELDLIVNDGFGLNIGGKWDMPKGSVMLSFSNKDMFSSIEDRDAFTDDFIRLLVKYDLPNGMFKKWSDSCSLCYQQIDENGTCTNPRCPNSKKKN